MSRPYRIALSCALLALAMPSHAEVRKYVGTDWVWFTDYVYWASEWTLNAEPGCTLEVGIGTKLRGRPLGGRFEFERYVKFVTRGFGAIHVRAVRGVAPCAVSLGQGAAEPVPVYGDPSVVKAAIEDGKKILPP